MNEKMNSQIHLRPRFTIDLNIDSATMIAKFKNTLKDKKCVFPSSFVDGHIIIDVPKNVGHFWSPQLNIEIVAIEANKSVLKGLFGPKPQVWTLFMFIHFVVGFSFLIFGVMLYVRWSLNESIIMPLMLVVFLPLLWILLYFLGRIGKSTGHHQMENLHDLMTSIVEN